MIYTDSTLFVFATAIVVHGFGINSSPQVCEGGILLCKTAALMLKIVVLTHTGLVCYMTTKILLYYWLVERAVSRTYTTNVVFS